MDILKEIIQHKHKTVENSKELYPVKLLEKSPYFNGPTVSLKKYLLRNDLNGIIAEFKRKSPSKGFINRYADVEQVTLGYMMAGASALSILTDTVYFGGKNDDLTVARKFNFCPILRKDFVIDEYQILEARSIGADAILLIAAVLDPAKIATLSAFAKSLGMEVLMEVHSQEEIERSLVDTIDAVGVNNRNLRSFITDVQTSVQLAKHIPSNFVKVSESGIDNFATVKALREHGYSGFLIGEQFMKNADPGVACRNFINQLKA